MLCSSFPYPREFRKRIWKSQRTSVAGVRGWGAIFDKGHGAQRHKAPFPAPPCGKWQESKRRRGRRQKKSGAKRRREGQLVRSVNHQGNTHLIDMWNLDSSNKSMSSTTMYRSSEICWWKPERGSNNWDLRPRSLLEVAVLLGGKTLHKQIITHYVFDPFRFLPSCS